MRLEEEEGQRHIICRCATRKRAWLCVAQGLHNCFLAIQPCGHRAHLFTSIIIDEIKSPTKLLKPISHSFSTHRSAMEKMLENIIYKIKATFYWWVLACLRVGLMPCVMRGAKAPRNTAHFAHTSSNTIIRKYISYSSHSLSKCSNVRAWLNLIQCWHATIPGVTNHAHARARVCASERERGRERRERGRSKKAESSKYNLTLFPPPSSTFLLNLDSPTFYPTH